jgi:hypothetical protein
MFSALVGIFKHPAGFEDPMEKTCKSGTPATLISKEPPGVSDV